MTIVSKSVLATLLGFLVGYLVGLQGGRYEFRKAIERNILKNHDFSIICNDAYRIWANDNGLVLSCWNSQKYALTPVDGNHEWTKVK